MIQIWLLYGAITLAVSLHYIITLGVTAIQTNHPLSIFWIEYPYSKSLEKLVNSSV